MTGLRRAWLLLVLGTLVVLVPHVLHFYLLMPIPGSQELDLAGVAYTLDGMRWLAYPAGLVTLAAGGWGLVRHRVPRAATAIGLALVSSAAILIATWTQKPSKVFQPMTAVSLSVETDLPPEALVLGVVHEDRPRAYPLRYLAYHHLVEDATGTEPLLVTYCVMGRTARAFAASAFELVGTNHYNDLIRDVATGSWWHQANGEAVAGPRAGDTLVPVAVEQMTLGAWRALHPDSQVLRPDASKADIYPRYEPFEAHRPDPAGGQDDWVGGAWVVGVEVGEAVKAYPWSVLARDRVVQDEIDGVPVVVHLRADGISFRAWDRRVAGDTLELEIGDDDRLLDRRSDASFGFDGTSPSGQRLTQVPASLELWHSIEHFRPTVSR